MLSISFFPLFFLLKPKYTVASFFPKSLFEQFRRIANFYFLVTGILSLTDLSPYGVVSALLPLALVISATMVKEGIEDWRRKQQDIEVNNRKVKVHDGNGIFWQEEWSNLIVGDIVRVEKDEFFSTDLLLLSSSYEDSICYVETMNLDGETNLKVKQGLEATSSLLHEDSDFKVLVRCEDPNVNLYVFVGTLALEKERFPLSIQQILLRDYKLRNTEYVYGAVVFTGHDTKTDIDEACKAEDYDFQPILKAYQLVGVNFLLLLYKKGIEGADEMGLGKTIQAITYLTLLNHLNNDPGPHLVVCPASVLENWERELRKWCPLFTIVQYHGAARAAYSRKLQRNNCILVEGAIEKGSTVYPPTRFHWKI